MKRKNKTINDEQLIRKMVMKTVRSVQKSDGDYGGKDLWKGEFLAWSGTEME